MGVNDYQTILRIELNDQMCYSEHHLMVPEHFYCWVAGSFNRPLFDRKGLTVGQKSFDFGPPAHLSLK